MNSNRERFELGVRREASVAGAKSVVKYSQYEDTSMISLSQRAKTRSPRIGEMGARPVKDPKAGRVMRDGVT